MALLYIGGICQDARLLGLITAARDRNARSAEEIRTLVAAHIEDEASAARATEALVAIVGEP